MPGCGQAGQNKARSPSPRLPALLMAKTEPLQSQEVSPLVGHTKQLSVVILKWIPSAGWHGQLEVWSIFHQHPRHYQGLSWGCWSFCLAMGSETLSLVVDSSVSLVLVVNQS